MALPRMKRDGVKYWRAADAIAELGSATLAELKAWDCIQFPHDPLGLLPEKKRSPLTGASVVGA